MDEASIDYSIILAMDFSKIASKYKGYTIPYSQQLPAIVENAAKDIF